MVTQTNLKTSGNAIVKVAFLFVLNLRMLTTIGYSAQDSHTNFDNQVDAVLVSISMPFVIVQQTKHIEGLKRMLMFGTGLILSIITSLSLVGFPYSFFTGLIPCLTIALVVLFYGGNNEK